MQLADLLPEDEKADETQVIEAEFVTEAVTDEIRHALKVAIAASAQSGLKILRVNQDEDAGQEILALNGEDAEATVIQSITSHFNLHEFEYELGSHSQNPDILFVVAELPEAGIKEEG